MSDRVGWVCGNCRDGRDCAVHETGRFAAFCINCRERRRYGNLLCDDCQRDMPFGQTPDGKWLWNVAKGWHRADTGEPGNPWKADAPT